MERIEAKEDADEHAIHEEGSLRQRRAGSIKHSRSLAPLCCSSGPRGVVGPIC